jgi:UEV domain/Vps23 core domain
MVSDSRVSRQLARLGGVYRDPARVNRDASSLLLSSVGMHLQPIAAVYADDTGDAQTVLVLQGTIAIHFRGQTYQLLVDIYLVPAYPNRPPVCFVRLAPNMYLKENHRHVEPDGKVFMPYLHEWNAHSHNLVEMTVALSSVFSADPPVFTRPPPKSSIVLPPPPPPTYISSSMVTSSATSSTALPSVSASTSTTSSAWKIQQEQLEALMAQEAADANAAAEAARLAEYQEQQALAQKASLEAYETAQRAQVRATVTAKLQTACRDQAALTQQCVRQDALDQYKLQDAKTKAPTNAITATTTAALVSEMSVAQQLEWFRQKKDALERQIAVVNAKTTEMNDWLAVVASSTAPSSTAIKKSMDEICVGASTLQNQMLDLAAENASLSDALYVLDRSLDAKRSQRSTNTSTSTSNSNSSEGVVTDHLRTVRKLAQRQFLVRAHLLKINSSAASRQGH